MILFRRSCGERHRDINWDEAREAFDRCNEVIEGQVASIRLRGVRCYFLKQHR